MIELILEEIGLTKNETKTYLALLELGESTTSKVLEKAGLNSGKIYEILTSLQKKGLVSYVTRNGKKFFTASNPKKILDYLEEKKKNIDEKERAVQEILPELQKITSQENKETKIEIHTGIEGLKTAYAEELKYKEGEELLILGVTQLKKYEKTITDFFVYNHMPKRKTKKYKIRKILDETTRKEAPKIHEKEAKIKYLPFPTTMCYQTIGDLTIISITKKEPLLITIKDEEVAKSMKHQFELLWGIAKE